MSKPVVFIIDIDTTIANNDHRAELLQKHCVVCGTAKTHEIRAHCRVCQNVTDDKVSQKSWDAFISADLVALDTPVKKAQEVIHYFRKQGLEFHFLTGRNELLRDVTEQWLRTYFGFDSSRESLVMRPIEARETPAGVYKERAFKDLVKARSLENSFFIFCEDDQYVFTTFSKYGLCMKCPEAWDYLMPSGLMGYGPWQRR